MRPLAPDHFHESCPKRFEVRSYTRSLADSAARNLKPVQDLRPPTPSASNKTQSTAGPDHLAPESHVISMGNSHCPGRLCRAATKPRGVQSRGIGDRLINPRDPS